MTLEEETSELIKSFLKNQKLIDDEPLRSFKDMNIGDTLNVTNVYSQLPEGLGDLNADKGVYTLMVVPISKTDHYIRGSVNREAFSHDDYDGWQTENLNKIKKTFDSERREPIIVSEGEDGLFTVIDGHHRLTIANELGRKSILALVRENKNNSSDSEWTENVNDISKRYHKIKSQLQNIPNPQISGLNFVSKIEEIINPDIRFKTGGSIRKPKKRTISQTPAPKKDRIYGSKINKPKSSESKSKASSIILSPSVIKSIRTKINQHNEEYPNKKIPLSSAKAVVRRGMGAYSSTHRPTISGGKPNSRVAWGLARLNAFIYKIVKGKSKSGKYKQDDDLINELGYRVKPYAYGGQITDEEKETYKKWKELVNMSRSELEKFYNSEEGKVAGLSSSEAKKAGIDSGRESARWIMKMKYVPVKEWNSNMWRWAKKQISFISRMSGVKGKLYDEKGRKTRKHLALLIWGHNPEK